ncbi:SDR family NAD(P)-dependent oxidoreductase, partial [bacterium]|nr:SDR family NAD(P)-dependent oxidoreductase [bacterium]
MGIHDGKVVIVTGGALGIGGGASRGFAEEGARVIVADIDPDAGHGAVDEIKADGGDAAFVQADFSVSADPKRVVDQAVAIYGGLDFVLKNRGIQP